MNRTIPLQSPHPPQTGSAGFFQRRDLAAELRSVQVLAPLPTVAQQILEIGNNPAASIADLCRAIEKDQSLTAKLLKTVNSAYYGFHRKVGNIQRAIVVLGFNEIINLTLATSIIQAYDGTDDPNFSRREFWIHALGCAHLARALVTIVPDVSPGDAFVIGLLHDFGKVVLDQHYHDDFTAVLSQAARDKRSLQEVEAEALGLDHAEIGGILAENWKLPPPLVHAIRYHHSFGASHSHQTEIALAHLANYFAHRYGIGGSGNPVPDELNKDCLEVLKLAGRDLEQVWLSLGVNPDKLQALI